MSKRVLVIGGYGNFGSFIAKVLAADNEIHLIIAGRSYTKAEKLCSEMNAVHKPEAICLDITVNLAEVLSQTKPDIVIHTSGPFQMQGYDVALACIAAGAHYIDLADGRDFVSGITALAEQASNSGVIVISGASSVPCLTAAIVDHYQHEFAAIEALDYGITTAQKTARGLATTAAILGYTGKPFQTLIEGQTKDIYGWQNLHARKFRDLGWRLLGNCDIPDLTLFPKRYPGLKNIRFYAGLEIKFIHMTLWLLSWLVRFGLINNLASAASLLLRLSFLFDWFGTASSAFYMRIVGKDKHNTDKTIICELTALLGDGPYIPCIPAILLAKKIASGAISNRGAYPCLGFITLEEYLQALSHLNISWRVS